MSTLRVGVDLLRFDPGALGPAEDALVDCLRAVAADPPDDVELVLFTSRAFAAAHADLREAFETHTLPVPPGVKVLRVAAELGWLRSAAGRAGLDVLHDAGGTSPGGIDVPRIVSVHDLAPLERPRGVGWLRVAYHRRVVPRAVAGARTVVVPSEFVRDRLVAAVGADPQKIDVVPWPLPRHEDAAPIDTVRARNGIIGQIVLLPGTTRPEADHLVAIRAMRHLASRHKETTLVLLGGAGAAERQVQEAVRTLGLEDRVVRLGDVRPPVRSALFEHAAVVVYPAVYGGFAHSVLEAMACGVPVVVAEAGAAPELVGGAGAVISAGDDAQLALEVHRVLDDRAWRERMVQAGLDRAREYTAPRAAAGLLATYRSVVAAL